MVHNSGRMKNLPGSYVGINRAVLSHDLVENLMVILN